MAVVDPSVILPIVALLMKSAKRQPYLQLAVEKKNADLYSNSILVKVSELR